MLVRIKVLFGFFRNITEKKDRIRLLLTALLAIVLNLLAVMIPVLQKRILDSMSQNYLNLRLLGFFFLAGIMILIASVFEVLVLNSLFISSKQKLTFKLLESVTRKNNRMLEARGPGAFMVGIFGNSEQLASLLKTNYFSVMAVCVASIATLVISLKWTWVFAVIVIISYLLMFAIITISNKIYAKNFEAGRELVYELNPKVLEYIENRKTISAYIDNKMYMAKLKAIINKRDQKFKTAFAANAIGDSAINSVKNLALTAFFVLSIIQIINKQLEISSFIALLTYFNLVFIPVRALHSLTADLDKFKILHERIKDNLDYEAKLSLPKHSLIEMQGVSFSFKDTKAFKNLNINLSGRIGLVGLTGEGKTTIINLLTGKLSPNTGAILYGGTDAEELPESIINASIRQYLQEPEIFDETLKFNITLGKKQLSQQRYLEELQRLTADIENALNHLVNKSTIGSKTEYCKRYLHTITTLYGIEEKHYSSSRFRNELFRDLEDKNIEEIAKNLAPLFLSKTSFVEEKYKGLISELKLEYLNGRRFGQRGKNISGGEKNKVALARFLLPESNEPYIIDEPFINLDLISEQENLDFLKSYTLGKNGIVISHKMNVVKALSDTIIVLEGGQISEQGSHDNLLKSGGLYSRLYQKYLDNIDDFQ